VKHRCGLQHFTLKPHEVVAELDLGFCAKLFPGRSGSYEVFVSFSGQNRKNCGPDPFVESARDVHSTVCCYEAEETPFKCS
jgi:hypothetical protein